MRVLGVMAGAPQGGAEAFFERLMAALPQAGIECATAIRKDEARAERLRAGGIAATQMAFGGWFDFATTWDIAYAIDRFKPDIALAFMSRAAAKLPGRYVLAHKPVYVGRLGGYYDLKYYKRCRHLIGNTKDICDWIVRQGWPAARVAYLPNFVDAAHAPAADRAALDTPADAKLVLALGRLHENKAFDVLLAAIAKLPKAYLWIAGTGPLEADLKAQAQALGIASRVRFLGWRSDTAALLAACDVLACPSRHEPLGNVVIEAWAQNRPVVAAAASGPAALIEDGRNGLLVPVDDADALATALARACNDAALAKGLVQEGAFSYQKAHTKEAVVRLYGEFFDAVRQ
jgi:glycosyltransferase involved in cell wall biosynthesis